MKTFEQICLHLSMKEFEFSRHALKRAVERNIGENEIAQMAENAELIENYPDDKYSPSCLIFGFTRENRPLHIQVSLVDAPMVKIITLYEPDAAEWIDFKRRS